MSDAISGSIKKMDICGKSCGVAICYHYILSLFLLSYVVVMVANFLNYDYISWLHCSNAFCVCMIFNIEFLMWAVVPNCYLSSF